jgi:hypothetical protein
MNPILKGGLGLLCLVLGPSIILVSETAVTDMVGVVLMLLDYGYWQPLSGVVYEMLNNGNSENCTCPCEEDGVGSYLLVHPRH